VFFIVTASTFPQYDLIINEPEHVQVVLLRKEYQSESKHTYDFFLTLAHEELLSCSLLLSTLIQHFPPIIWYLMF
jgi:hypothetical protein